MCSYFINFRVEQFFGRFFLIFSGVWTLRAWVKKFFREDVKLRKRETVIFLVFYGKMWIERGNLGEYSETWQKSWKSQSFFRFPFLKKCRKLENLVCSLNFLNFFLFLDQNIAEVPKYFFVFFFFFHHVLTPWPKNSGHLFLFDVGTFLP